MRLICSIFWRYIIWEDAINIFQIVIGACLIRSKEKILKFCMSVFLAIILVTRRRDIWASNSGQSSLNHGKAHVSIPGQFQA
jgi:hypothetical protein